MGSFPFTFCQTCAENESNDPCKHTDAERAMTGTWVSLEIQEALSQGYKIEKMYEVYHWAEKAVHDAKTRDSGLFSEYVQTFLKLKTEATSRFLNTRKEASFC